MQHTHHFQDTFVEQHIFDAGTSVKECHLMIHVNNSSLSFTQQLKAIIDSYNQLLSNELKDFTPAFKRYFVSDITNQIHDIRKTEANDTAWMAIQQPPLDGTKIALWVYLLTDVEKRITKSGLHEIRHNGYRHLWLGGANSGEQGAHDETTDILQRYVQQLTKEGLTLEKNCLRTWFFVNDIDNQYAGMVKARNEVFDNERLTVDTHFITSTGIEGRQADPSRRVTMDAYAIDGINSKQVHFLYASTHLNRTSDYGVRFERGTYIDYCHRRKIFLSGTASIDNRGEIVHPGDIRRQTERTLENVEALLREAGATFDDVEILIIYLRDSADYSVVAQMFDSRFPGKPRIIVNASVCRPGWLIEMECIADKNLPND